MFTLILPAFLRDEREQLPTLHTPALNDLLRWGRFQAAHQTRTQLYQTYLCDELRQPENVVYASPAWQQVGMNSVQLLAGTTLNITADEATILCTELNDVYAGEYIFQAAQPDLWTMTLPEKPQWFAPCILDVVGQMDGSEQASGDNISEWLRVSTEIPMWLNTHRINQTREIPINGIWLWNAPHISREDFQAASLMGTDSAWARYSSLPIHAAPIDWTTWQRVCAEQNVSVEQTAVFAEDFVASADVGDVWTYQQILSDWEMRWFVPLRDALRSGSLNALRLVCEQGECVITRQSRWAFWRSKVIFDGKRWG